VSLDQNASVLDDAGGWHPTVAFDIGGTKTGMAVVDGRGNILEQDSVPTGRLGDAIRTLDRMTDFTRRARTNYGVLEGIGIGMAAQIDPATGNVAGADDNIPGWAELQMRGHFWHTGGYRVAVDNDANVAALAEGWVGIAAGESDYICLTLGTGVGGGVVSGGRLLLGAWGGAAELGHMSVYPDGPPCYCGGRGCLELYVSGPFLLERARARGLVIERTSDLFALAVQRHVVAERLVSEAGMELGASVVSLVNILQPAVLVLGGGLARFAVPLWLPILDDMVRNRALPCNRKVRIAESTLGNDAALIGAARLLHLSRAP